MNFFKYIPTTILMVVLGAVFFTPVMISIGPETNNTSPAIAHAQDQYQFLAPISGLGEDGQIDVSSENSFPEYIQTLITLVIGFAIMAAIVVIVMAGFSYMTSTSQSKTSAAKKNIQNALLGLILALASVVILQTINPSLVELNSVQTVTTTGDSFSEVDPEPEEEFDGSVHLESERSHGDKHCMYIEADWSWWDFVGLGTRDRFICYDTGSECEEGREQAEEAGKDAGWWSELSCDFYYESQGQLIEDEGENVLESSIIGITERNIAGTDNAQVNAVQSCEAIARNMAEDEYRDECTTPQPVEFYFDSEKCSIECEEPEGP